MMKFHLVYNEPIIKQDYVTNNIKIELARKPDIVKSTKNIQHLTSFYNALTEIVRFFTPLKPLKVKNINMYLNIWELLGTMEIYRGIDEELKYVLV